MGVAHKLAYEPDSPSRWAHTKAYEIYEALNEDDTLTGDDHLVLDDDTCEAIKDLLLEEMGAAIAADRSLIAWKTQMYKIASLADLRDWFTDEKRHSPWVDEIAVDRAMGWDWPVIDSLTDMEWREFMRRCVARGWHAANHNDPATMSGLDRRWFMGSKEQRDRVTKGMKSLRAHGAGTEARPPYTAAKVAA